MPVSTRSTEIYISFKYHASICSSALLLPLLASLCSGARPDLPPPGLVVWGSGRRFSSGSAVWGFEVRCYVGKCRSHLKYNLDVI
jgi:hypothetical protein